MKNKKAQIKTFETIAVLLIFFVLLGFGLIFYSNVMGSSIDDTAEEQFELRAIQTAQLVSFLPELQCTSPTSTNIVVDDCFDVLKVEALSEILEDPSNQKIKNEYYFDSFGDSNIYIEQVYPSVSKWTIYDRKKPGSKSKSSIKIPVSLYDATENIYNFGVLNVEVYD
jgi:hypothetical protein